MQKTAGKLTKSLKHLFGLSRFWVQSAIGFMATWCAMLNGKIRVKHP